jgi:hypothetical protein
MRLGIFFFFLTLSAQAAEKHGLTEKLPGIESVPSTYLIELLKDWPKKDPFKPSPAPSPGLQIVCLETPGNSLYFGAEQVMQVRAPLSRVAQIIDDFSEYPALFDGLLSQNGNLLVVASEQHIPIPFVPNEKSEMYYLVNEPSSSRRVYRYQLKSSNHMKANDGLIILEKKSDSLTSYTEFDFWDADWGVAKALGAEKIWKDNLEGLYQSDLAILLRAEHLDWNDEKVMNESKALLKTMPITEDYRSRKPLR